MVESVALEMRSAGNGTEGSNPSLSSSLSHHRPADGLRAAPDSRGGGGACYNLTPIAGAVNEVTITPITTKSTIATMITTAVYPIALSCGTFIRIGSPR